MQKCEKINDLGITVNSAANKARGILYFIERLFTGLTKEIFVALYKAFVRPYLEYAIQANCPYLKKDIHHLERMQEAATRRVKDLAGFTNEERVKAVKLQSLGKRWLRSDLVLTHKIIYNRIDLEATHLFKFSRRPGLRRSSLGLIKQTGRTRRRGRNSFACRVVKYWNRLPLAVASLTQQLSFKRQIDAHIYP